MKTCSSNQRIRQLISELNISQTDFCKKAGITKSALSNYLNGDRQPRQDQLDKIANTFYVNPAWLMGYDVPREPFDVLDETEVKHDETAKRMLLYAALLKSAQIQRLVEAAKGCTSEQIQLAINVLNAMKTPGDIPALNPPEGK